MDRYELRRLDYSLSEDHQAIAGGVQAVLQDALSDRNRARRRGIRVRQEPVGAVVRDGRDDDGAAGVGGRGRGDARRPDAGRRGDRPVAGAGAVDRPCRARRVCWRGSGAPDADVVSGKQLAAIDPQHDERVGCPADPDRLDRRPDRGARRRRRRAADIRHAAGQGRQHRQAADGVGGSRGGRQPHRAGKRRRGAGGIPTRAG